MIKKTGKFPRKSVLLVLFCGFILGILVMIGGNKAVEETSTDEFCEACHVHPHVTESWKLSSHYDNKSGIRIHCVECHLPPRGHGYLTEKARLGMKDIYGYLFKDSTEFNWDAKSTVEQAQHFVYNESCIKCHANLFPLTLSKEGMDAHLYYSQNEKDLQCINCHLNVGHYDPNAIHASNTEFGKPSGANVQVYTEPATLEKFENFTEYIPNSTVSFNMIAIPGGAFKMGSPENEAMRKPDEGPVKPVEVSFFYLSEIEVSWDEFLAFYGQAGGEGRSSDTEGARLTADVDGITGPTPPYGQPDQNWGLGKRPAITMRYHAAETYCRWLSEVTGKTYRLPTEAEWEFACRGGTETSYFFRGDAKDYDQKRFWNKLFGSNTTLISQYVIYEENSQGKTQLPDAVDANPFGLKNMLGNVAEFCSDWYAPDAYKLIRDGIRDPKGPASGTERVIRGGSFKSRASEVRSASRDFTRDEAWMKTDPQMPKSIWWYSDCNMVGFRVVCEYNEATGKK
jgi:formylglycine-generating enzyme required for sulfatase activity